VQLPSGLGYRDTYRKQRERNRALANVKSQGLGDVVSPDQREQRLAVEHQAKCSPAIYSDIVNLEGDLHQKGQMLETMLKYFPTKRRRAQPSSHPTISESGDLEAGAMGDRERSNIEIARTPTGREDKPAEESSRVGFRQQALQIK
jgi:hypothetical protein